MELNGFEPRRSELARGIVIARSAKPLDPADQRALWALLATGGITEPEEVRDRPEGQGGEGGAGTQSEARAPREGIAGERGNENDEDEDEDEDDEEVSRQWLAAPWLPPSASELEAQRAAFEQAAARFGLEAIWCVKIETGIDGVAWLELADSEPLEETDEDAPEPGEEPEVVDAIFDEKAEVLYSAPDAPSPSVELAGESDDTDDDTDDDFEEDLIEGDIAGVLESHWRNGPPPFEHAVPFPIERFPEMIDDYDWESFGVAVKLSGPQLPGEESVVNAFFALWLSAYQDERADDFEPFQRADVVHDRTHRSALMWAERFAVPATATDQVHFLLWIVARINDIVPITWARFDSVDDAVKSRAISDDGNPPFILAGNPFADRFRRHGEEAALAWAVGQSAWSKRELAGMLIEVALEHDPDEVDTAVVAERLLRRALAFDASSDATGYLGIVLVRQHRIDEAAALARDAERRDVRLLVVGETAEHDPDELGAALELLDPQTLRETDPEETADLVASIARHAPDHLAATLARLPDDAALVPYLYNASFTVERPEGLAILGRVLALPVPPRDSGEARTALVMAWNNACIHAHALGDYPLAVELADGGQPYAPENPYIYHSAACAYAAVGEIDRAIEQVKLAIEHEYEHSERMETDPDLAPLHGDPRFAQLYREWRTRRADLN